MRCAPSRLLATTSLAALAAGLIAAATPAVGQQATPQSAEPAPRYLTWSGKGRAVQPPPTSAPYGAQDYGQPDQPQAHGAPQSYGAPQSQGASQGQNGDPAVASRLYGAVLPRSVAPSQRPSAYGSAPQQTYQDQAYVQPTPNARGLTPASAWMGRPGAAQGVPAGASAENAAPYYADPRQALHPQPAPQPAPGHASPAPQPAPLPQPERVWSSASHPVGAGPAAVYAATPETGRALPPVQHQHQPKYYQPPAREDVAAPAQHPAAQPQYQPQPQPQYQAQPAPQVVEQPHVASQPPVAQDPAPQQTPDQTPVATAHPVEQQVSNQPVDPTYDPMAPRRDAPIFRVGRPAAAVDSAASPAPQPTTRPAEQASVVSPTPQAGQSAAPSPTAGAASSATSGATPGPTPNGARYYSVHRQAGHRPDGVSTPQPIYLDALPVEMTTTPQSADLAEPPAAPNLYRNAQGRIQAVPDNSTPDAP